MRIAAIIAVATLSAVALALYVMGGIAEVVSGPIRPHLDKRSVVSSALFDANSEIVVIGSRSGRKVVFARLVEPVVIVPGAEVPREGATDEVPRWFRERLAARSATIPKWLASLSGEQLQPVERFDLASGHAAYVLVDRPLQPGRPSQAYIWVR